MYLNKLTRQPCGFFHSWLCKLYVYRFWEFQNTEIVEIQTFQKYENSRNTEDMYVSISISSFVQIQNQLISYLWGSYSDSIFTSAQIPNQLKSYIEGLG